MSNAANANNASKSNQPKSSLFVNLVNVNKHVRETALKKDVQKWIVSNSSNPALDLMEMMKLWKALYYTAWMGDKPFVQMDISETLSSFIKSFTSYKGVHLYLEAFFRTIEREWHGIDIWRMDKFYLLIRAMLCGYMKWLIALPEAQQTEQGKRYSRVIFSVLHPEDITADGIKYHLAFIFVDEMFKAGGRSLSMESLQMLLDPIYCLFSKPTNENVFASFVETFKKLSAHSNKQKDGNYFENMDVNVIGKSLFNIGADSGAISSKQRKAIYNLSQRFTKKDKNTNGNGLSEVREKLTFSPSKELVKITALERIKKQLEQQELNESNGKDQKNGKLENQKKRQSRDSDDEDEDSEEEDDDENSEEDDEMDYDDEEDEDDNDEMEEDEDEDEDSEEDEEEEEEEVKRPSKKSKIVRMPTPYVANKKRSVIAAPKTSKVAQYLKKKGLLNTNDAESEVASKPTAPTKKPTPTPTPKPTPAAAKAPAPLQQNNKPKKEEQKIETTPQGKNQKKAIVNELSTPKGPEAASKSVKFVLEANKSLSLNKITAKMAKTPIPPSKSLNSPLIGVLKKASAKKA